jgi:arylsulfatase A-like enzyme
VEARSENVDLWPTVLDLAGLPGLEDPDGHSLVPAIEAAARGGGRAEDGGTAFAQIDRAWARLEEEPRPDVAVTEGRWRLIYHAARPHLVELFDTSADPREQRNVAAGHPDVVARLVEKATAYLASPAPPWGEEAPLIEIDEMQLQQLRAIGYGVQ